MRIFPLFVAFNLICFCILSSGGQQVNDIVTVASSPSVWISIIDVVLLFPLLWMGFVLLLGSWKLFRFLIKWDP